LNMPKNYLLGFVCQDLSGKRNQFIIKQKNSKIALQCVVHLIILTRRNQYSWTVLFMSVNFGQIGIFIRPSEYCIVKMCYVGLVTFLFSNEYNTTFFKWVSLWQNIRYKYVNIKPFYHTRISYYDYFTGM